MSARNVCSGKLPNATCSVRAISAPSSRPPTFIFAPFTSRFCDMRSRYFLTVLRKGNRLSKSVAICWAMMALDTSLRFISSMESCSTTASVFPWVPRRLFNFCSISLVSSSIPFPPRPIISPGFAARISTRILLAVFSIVIESIPATPIFFWTMVRIRWSSRRAPSNLNFLGSHRDAYSFVIPVRNDVGLIFCPMIANLFNGYGCGCWYGLLVQFIVFTLPLTLNHTSFYTFYLYVFSTECSLQKSSFLRLLLYFCFCFCLLFFFFLHIHLLFRLVGFYFIFFCFFFFCNHKARLYTFFGLLQYERYMAGLFLDRRCTALGAGYPALEHGATIYPNIAYDKLSFIQILAFCVRNRRF